MEHKIDTKERLLDSATYLFSEKGYDGTRVSEIANMAKMSKALVYHYFSSKQEILDHLIKNFFDEVKDIGLRLIRGNITKMIQEGILDIQEDRLIFTDQNAETEYRRTMHQYYEDILSYLISHKQMLRIILAESLRNGEHHDALLKFFLHSGQGVEGTIHQELSDLDPDVYYSADVVFKKFFFSLLPMLNYIVLVDEYQAVSGLSSEETHRMFISALDKYYLDDLVGQGVWIL